MNKKIRATAMAKDVQATLLRAELQGLVSFQLAEMIKPVRDASDSLQGFLRRLESLLVRTAGALESLCLAPDRVQASPVQQELAAASATPHLLADAGFAAMPNKLALVLDADVPSAMEESVEFGSPCSEVNLTKEMTEVVGPQELSLESSDLEELEGDDAPCTEQSVKAMIQLDAVEPSTSLWGEFIEELALSVSGSTQLLEMWEAAPTHCERRSCRLDKISKECDIPVAKRAEYRRAEAFGEVPSIKSKGKATEEILNEKMQHYLQMYKKQHTPQVIQAVRDLVEINA